MNNNWREERIKEIDLQLDKLAAAMDAVPLDSEAYRKLVDQYKVLLKERKEITPINGKWFYILDKVSDKAILIVGNIVLPVFLGGLAFAGDKEMKLCNGRVWGLISKRFINK